MQQSNRYIIIFTLIMTIVVGGSLALVSQLLAPAQKKSIEFDTKSQILKAVMDISDVDDILSTYDSRIESLVVNVNGEEVTSTDKGPVVAENIDVAREYKKDYKDRLYPVFKFMNKENPNQVEAYIMPVYGAGLWDKIWGFVALKSDLETVAGVSFAHKAETPGLGARISSDEIQSRYQGKKIYNESDRFVSVTMVKGESGGGDASISNFDDKPHQVDGLSGATMTANGVNEMLKKYLDYYQKYFERVKSQGV